MADDLLAPAPNPNDIDRSEIGKLLAEGDEFADQLRTALTERPDIGHAELARRIQSHGHRISDKQVEGWRRKWGNR